MSAIKYKRVWNGSTSGGGSGGTGTGITAVVANYSALPAAASVSGQFYWVSNTQGTSWLPGFIGGTFYNSGIYYSNGVTWEHMETPYQATQADVDAGIITDQFVSPATLNGWGTTGPGGQTAFFTWKYSTNPAAADPGSGFFRGNNISAPSVTQLYIDDITSGNQVDISNLFAKVKGQWLLHIQQRNDASKWMQFTTAIPYTDNTGWWTLPVTFVQAGGGGSLTNLTDCLFTFVNQNDTPSSQGSTGIQTFASPGLSIASGTTINIGAVTGWIVDNETDPLNPTQTYVTYPGVSGLAVTTIGSGLISYILLSSSGVISFQNTLPTSAQRKSHIWLGKVSHPNLTSLAFINNEPDFVLSPHASYNDLFQVLGPYINDGVIASANGANLNINITAGNIHGNGINFVTDNTNPNEVNTGPFSPLSFIRRTQTGTGGGFTTTVDVGNYDVAGTVTAIPGGVNISTIQYIYAVPNVGFVIQYGQTLYNTLTEAIANVGRESQVIYSNLIGNSILVGVLVIKKSTTALNNTADARFYQADKLGQIVGSTAGIATGTLQTAYNNSVDPEILTDSTRDGVTIRRGSAADTDNILVGQNGAGTATFQVDGNGKITTAAEFTGAEPNSTATNRGYTLNTRNVAITFPVPTLRPTTINSVLAFDLMPNGSPIENGNGFTWMDMCSADILNSNASPCNTARVSIHSTSAEFGSRALNGATDVPIIFTITNATAATITAAGKMMLGTKTGVANYNLDIHQATAAACNIQFTNTNTGTANTDGLNVGIDATGNGLILLRENLALQFWTNSVMSWSITNGGVFTAVDAKNMAFGTTTGTKIGTATSQKIGFWNATPIIQPTTGIAAATFVANTSLIANDTATFDGYTIGQVVKALRDSGLLA